MSSIDVPLHKGGFGSTRRKDNWWVEPLLVFLGFGAFIVYSTWAALQNAHFEFGLIYRRFIRRCLMKDKPGWWPAFIPFSAAMLILWAPGGFDLLAITIAALTTKRSGPTRRRALWASRANPTGASAASAHLPKRASILPVSRAGVSS
jgi:hypothetical protein